MLNRASTPSHRCRLCRHEYTPTETQSEDCPMCDYNGTTRYVPTLGPDLFHRLVQPVSSGSGLLDNALDGVYGEINPEQHKHLSAALAALQTALECIHKANKA